MVTRIILCITALSLACLTTASNVVDLGYAKYRGNVSYPNTVAFLGLPFAEPPVGDRRWRAPLPLNTSRISHQAQGAVIDATTNPVFCVQGTTGGRESIIPLMSLMSINNDGQVATLEEQAVKIVSMSMFTRHSPPKLETNVRLYHLFAPDRSHNDVL
jgi:hypothetical protein